MSKIETTWLIVVSKKLAEKKISEKWKNEKPVPSVVIFVLVKSVITK